MRGDLIKELRLEFAEYVDKTYCEGKYDMPNTNCRISNLKIDELVLYSKRKQYIDFDNKAICFYEYDSKFDGYNGVYELITNSKKTKELNEFKKSISNYRIFIAPDYSICGDIPFVENLHRIFKSRVVAIYLVTKLNKIVIPNISFLDERTKEAAFMGIDKHTVVAINFMGCCKENKQKELLRWIVDETINELEPSAIVIYNVAVDNPFVNELINKIETHNIKCFLPDNRMWQRNKRLKELKETKK